MHVAKPVQTPLHEGKQAGNVFLFQNVLVGDRVFPRYAQDVSKAVRVYDFSGTTLLVEGPKATFIPLYIPCTIPLSAVLDVLAQVLPVVIGTASCNSLCIASYTS